MAYSTTSLHCCHHHQRVARSSGLQRTDSRFNGAVCLLVPESYYTRHTCHAHDKTRSHSGAVNISLQTPDKHSPVSPRSNPAARCSRR
ncbi:Piso0_003195 [Millerozyma farinosa CBS 7064]|uniref:Piso0_003195 protein n=1 Tax=Pichia sorbitophila (strain ATCC MYA-4447 / BCRC 22081 / CBS 7064 / NBRC 10061 / NRRL Y-12695) TaxID=559304 RepID=G8YHG0_PICSO|nr:Piso0_003195 [Millerozyma farinosa CBS 7064]CCE80862.1 Piso0_003195 [Millerozyma farinosa CBS 7064]